MKLYRFLSSLGFCLLAVHMTHTKNVARARGVQYQELTEAEKDFIQKQRSAENKRLQKALNKDIVIPPITQTIDEIALEAEERTATELEALRAEEELLKKEKLAAESAAVLPEEGLGLPDAPAAEPEVMDVAQAELSVLAKKYIDLANNPKVNAVVTAGQPTWDLTQQYTDANAAYIIANKIQQIAEEYRNPEPKTGLFSDHSPQKAIAAFKNDIWAAGKYMEEEWQDKGSELSGEFFSQDAQEAALNRIINHYIIKETP